MEQNIARSWISILLALVFPLVGLAATTPWQQPPQEVLEVLHAPDLPSVWDSPDSSLLLLATPVRYPPLKDKATAMLPLAGIRVDARTNGYHGRNGYTSPTIMRVEDGSTKPVALPEGTRLLDFFWSADSERLAITVKHDDRVGLWIGKADGTGKEIEGLAVNPLLGSSVLWMPDQRHLLVKTVPERGDPPPAPVIPAGPIIRAGEGGTATSTYEARDVLTTAHDEALFEYYGTGQIVLIDTDDLGVTKVGKPHIFSSVSSSPNGELLLVRYLVPPWSHRHAYWRFGSQSEVWNLKGERMYVAATLPLADAVPIHGVPEGPRSMSWRPTAPATLVWREALDGGDWSNEVPHRDRLMMHAWPFEGEPVEVFKSEHRLSGPWWGEKPGTQLVYQYERARRWEYVWLIDVDRGTSRLLYDLSTNDRYADPGWPVMKQLANGSWVLEQAGDDVFYSGSGSGPEGDRPFLDRRSLKTGKVERLWRSDPERYERFMGFVDADAGTFLVRGESTTDPPNTYLAKLGKKKKAEEGEATREVTLSAVTSFPDPVPELRGIEKRLVTYEREDGTPLSFRLYLPPGYEEGTKLPTVVYAYPLEFSDPGTAGQVRGSQKTFTRIGGASHMFFLLQGYAVLDDTRMPVIGDPDTMYDTFVDQLVAGAEAAVEKAVEMGIADPDRIGVTGHSHGGLMTVTLLAHSDLFRAGIARSGSYNHTIRPFGFQSERRTLWESKESYLHLSPVMHAPKIDEPLLLIHGELDENPGTIPFQSERLFEAVRGTGGTTRLLMLPFEGHGYRARESVEHVLWEQLEWFDRYVKNAQPRPAGQER